MSFIYSMIDTWNDGATTFTAVKMNVTDTASAAGSLLLDLQVGGASKISGTKAGALRVSDGDAGVPTYSFLTSANSGMYLHEGTGQVRISKSGTDVLAAQAGATKGLQLGDGFLGFGTSISSGDVFLLRDAANTLAQRNGTAAQAFTLSNSHTDASNYERGGFDWRATANTLRIRSEAAGTGTVRIIAIDGFSKAGAAVAGDIPAGSWALVRDTVGATTKLIYNNAGTLMSVALA